MTSDPNNLEQDYQRVVHDVAETRLLPGTAVEIIRDVRLDRPPEHALFDFDGTLSLIREGWPEVMVPMMVEVLQETGTGESADDLHRLAYDFVMRLTGKQTIYQMIQLAEEVQKRGGKPRPPVQYKQRYHARLMERIESRREDLRSKRVAPEEMLVPGSLPMLAALRDRGVPLYLASGTDEHYVREEAELLGLTPYFAQHIYGAVDDYRAFSKAQVIQRILQTNRIDGSRLLGFGDGYVEIQNIKEVGGTAVAVASDEAGRSGKPDAWKRDRLVGVGADVVIPDFRHGQAVLDYLWTGSGRSPTPQ
jgi:phosphoglycolate phosphatase-like HAD superfamily hydrolase